MNWYTKSIDETLKIQEVTASTGLSEKESQRRQKSYGPNELVAKKNKSIFTKFFEQFADFMIITLICAAAISFFVSLLNGELDFVDPIIILMIITLNAILGVIQESKAERSLEALKKMSAPTACVLRDGQVAHIPAKDIVPGDIIKLEAGYFVPADARLIEAVNLKVEEASLTGESHPVDKDAHVVLPENTQIGDRRNLVLSTSIVTYGRGTAVVINTGMSTEVGHIAKLMMEDTTPMTPLQKRLAGTSKVLGIAALIICIVIFIIGVIKQRPIFDMFMTSVSLAVAAIPEGLPAIVTIMLSLGVQRMAKKNAVIRKLPAVETLGSATVICSDKTGTLTQNLMTVTEIVSVKGKEQDDSSFSNLLLTMGALCNDAILQINGNQTIANGEPTEKAIILAAHRIGINKMKLDLNQKRVHEIPFDSTRKLMTTVHKMERDYRSITKGAYDVLINRCTHIYSGGKIIPITSIQRTHLDRLNLSMAERALRVIAVGFKNVDNIANNHTKSTLETGLTFLGFIGMIDPPREGVKESVATCKLAGIKPVMITGDHVSTACAIAKELGIMGPRDKAITGEELSRIPSKELSDVIGQYSVFARVSPEHKVRIVKAFQNAGNVVAMTGDGVNDAPALKSADIGCAMGITGTDVAKNAADIILTDDNFNTIVSAVKEGRGIYDNIRKAIHFLLSSNIGEIITIFVAILLGLPSPLLAVQLLWVNLVTDSLPAISLGVEPAAKDIMKKKPIDPSKGMFADGLIFKILFEGIMIGLLALTAYLIGVRFYDFKETFPGLKFTHHLLADIPPQVGRTMAFAVLSISQLFHSFNMRSEHSLTKIGFFTNPKILLSFIVCTAMQMSVISIKPLATIFKVVALTPAQWSIVFMLSFLPIVIVEFQKQANDVKLVKKEKRSRAQVEKYLP